MDKAEIRQIEEIKQYKAELSKTNSKQRRYELHQHIRKLERELREYRQLRYGIITKKMCHNKTFLKKCEYFVDKN